MGVEETKHDLLLKRAQITIAILVGLVSLIAAVYNVKNNILSDKSPGKISVTVVSQERQVVGGAHVEFLNAQGALVDTGETNRGGQCVAENLPPGGYTVKVSHPSFEPELVTIQVSPRKTTDAALVLKVLPQGQQAPASPIKSALEEAGASWIKKITRAPSKTAPAETQSETVKK